MQKYYNEDTEKFRSVWCNKPRREKKELRKRIMKACMVEYSTVTNWLSGTCMIHPLAKKKIEKAIGQKIF